MKLKQFSYVDFDDADGIPTALEALAPSIEEARGDRRRPTDSPLVGFPPLELLS